MKRFYFFLLKTDHFWSFNAFADNLGQKNCRLRQFLAQFLFTKSETKLDYYHQKMKLRVVSQVAKQRKTQNHRKLGNFKKTSEMLGFDSEYPPGHPKTKF